MATKESCATTEERGENLGSKQQVIESYMFEPSKGDQDSGSEEEEFDEEFEVANAWRLTTLQ